MVNLIAAAAFFLAIHFGVSGTRLRDRLVRVVGDKPFLGLFALASIIGLIWLGRAYSHAPHVSLWGQLLALKPVAMPLLLIAFLFIVIGIATPSPTKVGMESRLDETGAQGSDGEEVGADRMDVAAQMADVAVGER